MGMPEGGGDMEWVGRNDTVSMELGLVAGHGGEGPSSRAS